MRSEQSGCAKAFSLVEITIAIGIFSFCILGIVGLFGIALDASRESQRDSALIGILRSVDAELRFKTADGAAPSTLGAAGNGVLHFYFDAAGNLLPSEVADTNYKVTAQPLSAGSIQDPDLQELASASGHTYLCLWSVEVAYPYPSYSNQSRHCLSHALYNPEATFSSP